ncbi:MAG TPA: hypothetical protein VFN73_01950 [Propionibacteriaceae bacterium]|nr:hypothetical protein [Propionibacteriaceae bacterium]
MLIGSGLLPLLMMGLVVWFFFARAGRSQQQLAVRQQAQLASVLAASRAAAEEDVTRFGEELQRLDSDVVGHELDEAMQQDYTRALDAYDHAKESLAAVQRPEEISNVTEILEDGRYAVACVKARVAGEPLPQKRPPCFFNPAHGPSVRNVMWSPNGGVAREIPACAADAERVEAGADPYIRTVQLGSRRVPYWQGGPAYAPWAQGYYTGWRGNSLLGDLVVGSLIFNGMSGLPFMLGGMGQGLGAIGGGIGDGLGQIGTGIGDGLGQIGDGIGDAFGDIGDFFGDLF